MALENSFLVWVNILVPLYTHTHVLTQINQKVHRLTWGCPRGVMVKAMDCGIVESEFVLQSCYYVHFGTNTLEKGMNLLILPVMG